MLTGGGCRRSKSARSIWRTCQVAMQGDGSAVTKAILPASDLTALGLGESNNRYMMESRAGPL